ncbi:MAG: hypothetical protein ACXWUG_20450 [Polyangiales bacterium]
MTLRHALFAVPFFLVACGGSVVESSTSDTGTTGDGASSDTGTTTSDTGVSLDASTEGKCGGKAGLACPADMWCSYDLGTCKNPDELGTCRKREALPCAAPMPGDEVCGCDGNTYKSACVATSAGMSIDHAGTCDTSTAKVCGGLGGIECDATEYCDWGTPPTLCGGDDGTGICEKRPTSCIPADGIFCGCDGKIYESPCAAAKAGQGLRKNGPC